MPVRKTVQRRRKPVSRAMNKAVVSGRGAYNIDASYKRQRKAYKRAKAQPDYEPSLGRQLLSEGGSMLGGLVGMPGLGKAAGNALSNIFGLGSYEIKENVFMEGRLPQVMNIPSGGGTVIRFQEYLGDVITSSVAGDFENKDWTINAANRDSFPFLSQIACSYEQYQFEGLIFEFRSTSCDALNSTNTALGSVMLATQYDFADTPFSSKAEMLNYEYSNSVKPSENCLHMVECAPNQTTLPIMYTLDGSVPEGQDSRLYHLGRFNIATIGFQAPSVRVGEIHVTYQVRLLKPKLYSALGLDNDFSRLANTTYSNALPFGPSSSFNIVDNYGCTYSSTSVNFPETSLVKTYRVELYWKGATSVVTLPTLTFNNCTNLTQRNTTNGTSTQEVFILLAIRTTGNNSPASIVFGSAGTLPATGTEFNCRVMEVPLAS